MAAQKPALERGLQQVRRLFADAGVRYLFVGGVAVAHHGYARATRGLDVLVDRAAAGLAPEVLAAHGFERPSARRLRHTETGTDVSLLVAGDPRPRAGAPPYPALADVGRSPRAADVVDLATLLDLKIVAGRHQDLADVVGLLKALDDTAYLTLEAGTRRELRPRLAQLRRDALDELELDRAL